MGVYRGFKLHHYFNACACALCGLLLSACPRSASHNSVNTHQNENRFPAFGSLTSSAGVDQRTNGPVNAHLSLLHIPINMFEYYGI